MPDLVEQATAGSWSTAVPDWKYRITSGRSLIPTLPLFEKVAEKAVRIFSRLHVPDIIGTPTYGEVSEPWVIDFVRAIFGSYDPEIKKRMIREFFLLVPKKNGKSAIAAGIIVTAAIMNERPEAELLLIAPTKGIANIAFKQARGIVRLDSELTKIFHVQQHLRQITHRQTLAVIVIKAADTDAITGSKATYILIDETHVFATKPKAAEVFLEIRGSLGSNVDGFLLQITTQSKKPPAGVFRSELSRARAVRDGEMQLPILAVMYELPPEISKDGGWRDRKNWVMVNPNLNVSIQSDYLSDELEVAERDGADKLALFASQHFNVEIGIGQTSDTWVGGQLWEAAADQYMDLDYILDNSEVIVAGVDGGGMDDLLGFALVGRHKFTKAWMSWNKAWAHKIVLERRKSIAPILNDFAQSGDLTICETPTQDIDELVEICQRVNDMGLFPDRAAIGLDPEGVAQILDALELAGIDGSEQGQLVSVTQGYRLNGAIKGTERKLFDGTLSHCGQPIMNWCVGNAKTETRGNAVIVTKAVSGSGKIDPLMALFDAVMLMARNPDAIGTGSMLLELDEGVF